jgi:iron complex outermembrane receptor protein
LSSPYLRRRVAAGLTFRLLVGAAVGVLIAAPALAQTGQGGNAGSDPDTEVGEVVVSGSLKPFGSVVGDIAPEIVLSPREIQAYGVGSITELLGALAPQTSSAQGSGGPPVTLINGARISGFAEIRDLPTEAIARVDILPEEVSLKYGYSADQKVVNIVLRQRFRAKTAEASVLAPTQSGGGDTFADHGQVLRIERGVRTTLDERTTHTDAILESDRDISGGDGAFRSLQPEQTEVTLNGTLVRPLGDKGVSGTINGVLDGAKNQWRLGPSPLGSEPLLLTLRNEDAQLSGLLNGAYAGWQWSSNAKADHNESQSTTDRALNGLAYTDRSQGITNSLTADLVANRTLWTLPAGKVSTTLTARASTLDLQSDGVRAGVAQSTDLTRTIGQLQANLDLPLAKPGQGLGAAIGKLSGNLNLSHQQLSDFGGLNTLGGGLNWNPFTPIRLLASFTRTDQAPTINQLGDPLVSTPGVRVFDLTRGQTVEVTRLTGGTQNLEAGQRNVFKLGANYKPFTKTNLTFQANYVSSRTDDAIAAFPSASTQVEAAFPGRFIRDSTGGLVQIDARAVNFARHSRDELRWGFTYSRSLGPPPPTPEQIAGFRQRAQAGGAAAGQRQAGQGGQNRQGQNAGAPPAQGQQAQGQPDQPPPNGPPPGDRPPGDGPGPGPGGPGGPGGGPRGGGPGGRGGGFGGFGGGPPRGGVLTIGLYHTVVFRDEILIRSGVPVLDLLDGAAVGSGGGSPRHQIDLQTNLTWRGMGAAMNAKWQSPTDVIGAPGQDSLAFSDLTTVNLRLFADLGQQPWARKHPFLRGARATLALNNLFDERQKVTSSGGLTPISYQPDLLDPVGRSVKLTVRKLFF